VQLIDGAPVYSATDLVGFLACEHRFDLERAALNGFVRKPIRDDPSIDLIARRGTEHEKRYLADLISSGRTVVEIARDGSKAGDADDLRMAEAETVAAMWAGADVIYQATFFDGRWRGHADFLMRVERPSALGPWSYEVADTKLARHVKAGAILQVCSYVEQVTRVQGVEPEHLHIVLGGSARAVESFRVADFMAYFRRVKTDFEAAASAGAPAYPPTETYPEPVEHCLVCRWRPLCRDRRRSDDDLSLVAGIAARQRRALKDRSVPTRRGLAGLELPLVPPLEGTSREALARVREQARIQVESEDEGAIKWEFLLPLETGEDGKPVPDRGFLVLPEPSAGDLFFDIEGDPFALDDGVDYLFGLLEPGLVDGAGGATYHEVWSRDDDGQVTLAAEKRAFEALVDHVIARLDADPTLHVYHYAAYERTALTRLAQRHATREEEVDRLLRGNVLVDLYRVVRQGLRAGVESYSIKKLEPLYGYHREVDLRDANTSIVEFEAWLEGAETEDGHVGDGILREIAGYNRDDVVSTLRLRNWLEDGRTELEETLEEHLPRPPIGEEAKEAKPLGERAQRVADLVGVLTADLGDVEPSGRTPEQQATWLLAQLLGWHRREDKAFWWRYFDLCSKQDDELVDEREPLGAITLVDTGEPNKHGTVEQVFEFPPQLHDLSPGVEVHDPATRRLAGVVLEIDEIARTVRLKRTEKALECGAPGSLIPYEHFPTNAQEEALLEIGSHVAAHGIAGDGKFRAARDLLLRRPPRVAGVQPGGPLRRPNETSLAAGRRLAMELDETTLPIQGPPGTGKTWTGARMIVDLVLAGRKVGVTANSHKVIGNVLDNVADAAVERGVAVRLGQKPANGEEPTCRRARPLGSNGDVASALSDNEIDVVGGTAWLWASTALASSIDVLVIDEAGQVSLANTVAVAPAARSLVLIGDPQQLDQPLKGSHPPGAERSALAHLLGDAPTIAPDAGLFLDRTWRLHPSICAFTSELFYAGDLEPETITAGQRVDGAAPFRGTGIRWLPVEHRDNATDAPEEAARIGALLDDLLASRATWVNPRGERRPVRLDDVVIVAPYNAHVDRIAAALSRGARVGTVDKFQGQEAPISIYAMGTSSPELAPRGMEFLYSLHRLNVATSRARCIAVVVASPHLLRAECRTPRQMRLANALCRLVEIADAVPGGPDG
jgi:predicted RecB family nuclease